jgi:glycerate 2-kinase
MALAFSKHSFGLENVIFLSGGTDGQDGPCDVAGAWVKSNDPISGTLEALNNNDSYNLFKNQRPDQHIKTGLTFTNVMDVHMIYMT